MIGLRKLVCAAILLALDPDGAPTPWLRLEVLARGQVVWTRRALDGERFDLSYMHSSERCRWIHHFVVESHGVRQLGSTFPCFGAGMPIASTDGTPVTRSADGFVVAAPLALGALRMINWRPAAITLRYRSHEIPIGELLSDFALFEITIQ